MIAEASVVVDVDKDILAPFHEAGLVGAYQDFFDEFILSTQQQDRPLDANALNQFFADAVIIFAVIVHIDHLQIKEFP